MAQARAEVDAYIQMPSQQRTSQKFDHAILSMFAVWDVNRDFLKLLMTQSASKDSDMSNYFTSILILTDMRDQAGRIASNIIAPITFSEPISDENRARSLQTQHQAEYLWSLVDYRAESWLELLEKADQSMLRAKAKGKNIVES